MSGLHEDVKVEQLTMIQTGEGGFFLIILYCWD